MRANLNRDILCRMPSNALVFDTGSPVIDRFWFAANQPRNLIFLPRD